MLTLTECACLFSSRADSLGGNAKTLMFVNVGPAASNISESVDSLAYGDLVKNITNEVTREAKQAGGTAQARQVAAVLSALDGVSLLRRSWVAASPGGSHRHGVSA